MTKPPPVKMISKFQKMFSQNKRSTVNVLSVLLAQIWKQSIYTNLENTHCIKISVYIAAY